MVTQKTFRLRGVARRSDEKYVKDLVQRALRCPDDVNIQVRSLADDPYLDDEEMMATLEFSPVPEILNQSSRLKLTLDDCDLEFDSDFFDFTALHTPAKEDCTIDVVAVSGLNGHGFGSFKERNGSWMWLRDGLTRDLPNSRILVFALDTHLVGSESFQNIADLGGRLCTALSLVRKEPERPLVLIGHSLGGIIVKEAVNLMANSKAEADQASFRALAGIVLFGVPSQGMAIGSLVPMVGDGPNRALLEALGPNSNVLRNQSEAFLKIFNSDVTFRIVNFYETQKSPTAVQDETTLRWTMTGPTEILVDPHSATNGRVHNEATNHNHGIDSTHSDLVKFSSRRDGNYRIVVEHLKKMQGFSGLKRGVWDSECSHSLAFAEQSLRVVQLEPARGTCKWLLCNDDLTSWFSEPCSLLWIRGKPGSGKSMAMKALLQHMRSTTSLNTFVVSFFIQGTGSPLQKTPLGLYRSLLHQLYQEFPGAFASLTETFKKKTRESGEIGAKWTWTAEDLLKHLSRGLRTASQHQPITIIIDALDEAGEESARKIVEAMKSLLSSINRSAQLRICFSCRHYPQITLDGGRTIVLEDWNTDDISRVVKTRLKRSNFTHQEKHLLQKKVFANSDGVFQWTSLVLDSIIDSRTHGHAFTETLKMAQEVPTDLHRLYESLLQPTSKTLPTISQRDLREQQRTLKLFQWVLFAARPLAPIELQQALALDWHMTQESIAEYQAEDNFITQENLALRVKSLSKGLINICGSFLSGQVQFIHQSVPDFLTGPANILQSLSLDPAIPSAWLAQFQISRSCLRYLLMGEIRRKFSMKSSLDWLHEQNSRRHSSETGEDVYREIPVPFEFWGYDQNIVERIFQEFPFILYAWKYWAFHAESVQRQGFGTPDVFDQHDPLDAAQWSVESSLKKLSEELTSSLGSPMESCYEKLHGDLIFTHLAPLLSYKQWPYIYAHGSFEPEGYFHQMTHILAFCGLTGYLEKLAKSRPALLEEKGIHGYNALSYAIEGKQRQTVLVLLRAGSDLNIVLGDHKRRKSGLHSPLCLACIWGDLEIISLMIEAGAKVNPEGCDVSPLHCATFAGHANIIDLLITAGAKANGEKKQMLSPLHALAISSKAHPDTASQLMNYGARLDTLDWKLRNPLHISVWNSPMPLFKIFLREAIAFEDMLKDRNRKMPSAASKTLLGHEEVPSIINGQDEFGESPIFLAARYADCERLRLLHEAGADINIKNGLGATPVFGVATRRYGLRSDRLMALELLLKYGADMDARDKKGRTPLAEAARRGNFRIAAFLLEHGAEATARDKEGRTPIAKASRRGSVDIAASLLKHGADVNATDKQGQTPIAEAARGGRSEIVQFLIEHGAEVNARDNQGMTPLLWAVKRFERVRERTLANSLRCIEMVELLRKSGADVHAINNSGRNALFYLRKESPLSTHISALLQEAGLQEVEGESDPDDREPEPNSEHEPEQEQEPEPEKEQDHEQEHEQDQDQDQEQEQEQEQKHEHEHEHEHEQEREPDPEHLNAFRPRFLRKKASKIKIAVRKWVGAIGKSPAK